MSVVLVPALNAPDGRMLAAAFAGLGERTWPQGAAAPQAAARRWRRGLWR